MNPVVSIVEKGTHNRLCLASFRGVIIVVFVYLLFLYQYSITVYYGIWFGSFDENIPAASANTIIFSIFWILMVSSHIKAVITKAGYIPFDKKILNESHMTSSN